MTTIRYLNVFYVKSNLKHDIEDIDLGFRSTIETPLYFYYIPPKIDKEMVKFPDTPIYGDFN